MKAKHWLVKTEPNEFSIDDLRAKKQQGEPWNGIRNYQARNFLREMQTGDVVFIYHSACSVPAIVGMGKVIQEAYPDTDALNPQSKYFDSKSTIDNNRWSLVDIQFSEKWETPLTLKQLKANPALTQMKLIKQSRLSVCPVTDEEFDEIMALNANFS